MVEDRAGLYDRVTHRLDQTVGILWRLCKIEVLLILVLVFGVVVSGAVFGGLDVVRWLL